MYITIPIGPRKNAKINCCRFVSGDLSKIETKASKPTINHKIKNELIRRNVYINCDLFRF